MFTSADEVPRRLHADADETCIVPDFETLERVVGAGVDSAQVAIVPGTAAASWSEAAVARRRGAAFVPPEPFRFDERLLVIVPTYNESESLERLIGAIGRHLTCDVLVVDDGSPDGTGAIADRLAAEHDWVHVLHRSAKQGLGRAYIAGFRWGLARGYDRLFEMDADFSHPPHDLPRLAHASARADLVIGSRYVRGGDTRGWSLARRLISRAGNLYAKVWLWLRVRDATAGFRCYHADVLGRIDLDAVTTDGYAFQIELAWRVHRAGGVIREVPIRFADRDAGHSKMNSSIAFEAATKIPLLRFRA